MSFTDQNTQNSFEINVDNPEDSIQCQEIHRNSFNFQQSKQNQSKNALNHQIQQVKTSFQQKRCDMTRMDDNISSIQGQILNDIDCKNSAFNRSKFNNFSDEFDQREKIKNISQTEVSTSEGSINANKIVPQDPVKLRIIENIERDQVSIDDISSLYQTWLESQKMNPINQFNVQKGFNTLFVNIKKIMHIEAQREQLQPIIVIPESPPVSKTAKIPEIITIPTPQNEPSNLIDQQKPSSEVFQITSSQNQFQYQDEFEEEEGEDEQSLVEVSESELQNQTQEISDKSQSQEPIIEYNLESSNENIQGEEQKFMSNLNFICQPVKKLRALSIKLGMKRCHRRSKRIEKNQQSRLSNHKRMANSDCSDDEESKPLTDSQAVKNKIQQMMRFANGDLCTQEDTLTSGKKFRKGKTLFAKSKCADEHKCPECGQNFRNGQGLGGHMSRVHQGQSRSYQRKIQVRQDRTFDRLMFRCAKYFHDKREDVISQDDSDIDRAFIRRWKQKIYKFLELEQNIKVSNFVNYQEDEIYEMVVNRFINEPLY